MAEFEDLLVRVQRLEVVTGEPERYRVELAMPGGRSIAEPAVRGLTSYREPERDTPEALAAAGLDLFHRLFAGSLGVAFQQTWAAALARGRKLRLRLALDPQVPALHAVPWELMYFDDSGGMTTPRPVAADPQIAFARTIESASFAEGHPVAERPIRLLLAIASPSDLEQWGLAPLDKAADLRDLQTRFSAAIASGQFQVDTLDLVSEEALQRALTQGSVAPEAPAHPRGYDVLLYYGHALHSPDQGTRLVLETPVTRYVWLYADEDLLSLMQGLPASHQPSLVVLVACNSAATGDLNSLAARLLIDSGVPAVIAMQRLVEISLARAFTRHLSELLLRDGLIDVAVNAARRRVFRSASLSWSTPVLYMRNPEGRLFSPNAQLEYVEQVLRDADFVRWSGAEYIEVGAHVVAPGQDWNLLRLRPEDAPTMSGVIVALNRALGLGLRPLRRRDEQASRSPLNLAALIGPRQSGQTTTMRRLTYELATAITHDVTRPLGLYISLTGFELQQGPDRLERQIVAQARAVAPSLAAPLEELFREAGHTGAARPPRFVFLLDELESLSERGRVALAYALEKLARSLPNERFVLSAAFDSYPGQILRTAQVFVLQALGEQQIMAYLAGRNAERAGQIYERIRTNRLLSLAANPCLLALIYERLTAEREARLTRNQLIQDYLERLLSPVAPSFRLGDVARESLVALAWAGRWAHCERLRLAEVFRVLAEVRRERDYSLEGLLDLLREAGLLTGSGRQGMRFVNPLLQTYCAALALTGRPDREERLADLVALCASPGRLSWWEEVLYSLAGLLADPSPLFELLAAAVRDGSGVHALLAARCLEALSPEQELRLAPALRAELLDGWVLRLRSEREPQVERREQLVSSIGRLNYQQLRHELRRILIEKVRPTSSGLRYEYTNVRIAAARALRKIYQDWATAEPPDRGSADLVLSSTADQASLRVSSSPLSARAPSIEERQADQMLSRLMGIWLKGLDGRAELHDLLATSPSAPERALAAFALGDLNDRARGRPYDVRRLLRVILGPNDTHDQAISADWQDTMWSAADALTLFDPGLVEPLLTVLIRRSKAIPEMAAQQLAYLAGRVRARDEMVIGWLLSLLVTSPSQAVKAKALQSLAWIGQVAPEADAETAEAGELMARRLTLRDGLSGPSVRELIEALAAAHPIPELSLGRFVVTMHEGDPPGCPLYLRRKAIEALAWVGDTTLLERLGAEVGTWPITLREQWYLTAAMINGRYRMESEEQ